MLGGGGLSQVKKSKRSQKKRKRLSGGAQKGQRRPRPVLSEEDYPQQPEFDPTAGAVRRPQPSRGGPSQQPRRNAAAPGQRRAQRNQQPNPRRPQGPQGQANPARRRPRPDSQPQESIDGRVGRPQRPSGQQHQVNPSGRQPQVDPGASSQQDAAYEHPQSSNRPQQAPGTSPFRAMSRTGAGKRRTGGSRPSSLNTSNPITPRSAGATGPSATPPNATPASSTPRPGQANLSPSSVGEHTQAFQRVNPLAEQPDVPDNGPNSRPPTRPDTLPGAPSEPTSVNAPSIGQTAAHTSGSNPIPPVPGVAGRPSGRQPNLGQPPAKPIRQPDPGSSSVAGTKQQPSLAAKPMNSAAARRTQQEASRLAAEAAAPTAAANVAKPVGIPDAPTQSAISVPDSSGSDGGPPTEAFDVTSLNPSGQVDATKAGEATTFSPEVAKPMEPAIEPMAARRPTPDASGARRPKIETPEGKGRGKKTKKPLPQSGRKAPKKPSEPTKTLLAVALSGIVLVGLGVATFMFLRNGGDDTEAASGDEQVATNEQDSTTDEEPAASETTAPAEDVAALDGAPFVNVANDAAALGPLQAGTEYEMLVEGASPEASFRYLVDGQPVGESFTDAAPALSLDPGRQVIALEQTLNGEVTVGSGVAVYVLGETPPRSYRANLKSVNVETEGWAEAVKQFDLLSETHPDLKLTPSDPYPSLTPGYWNLYIDGFDTSEAANAYCESKGLAIPDSCFSKLFDPSAPAE